MPTSDLDLWTTCFPRRPDARLRLICFPHAGGGPGVFRTWNQELPETLEVRAVLLPGRERRHSEPLGTELHVLAERLGTSLAPALDRPFAFFGHSLGAVLAFEVTRRLRQHGFAPTHLFVAARRAPQLADPLPPICHLPDMEFAAEITRRYNGIPAILRQDPDLLRFFIPIVRADIALLETYVYRHDDPLGCPIVALGGQDDRQVSSEVLAAWQVQTVGKFEHRLFPGDHFFPQQSQAAVLRTVREFLSDRLV